MADQGAKSAKEHKVVSVRLTKELHRRAKRYAVDHDCDLQDVVAEALENFLAKKRGA